MATPNNMIALLGSDDYIESVPSTSVVNGRLRYIVLDVDKPGKLFFNLQDVFNATVGEKNKILPIQFRRGGEPIPLNNIQISMDGTYPSGTGFHVVGDELDANSAVTQFTLLDGLFQEVGDYVFTFTIKNTTTGAKETSRPCFFSVSQNINSLAIDWSNGVSPYDSEFDKWKTEVTAQVNNLKTDINNLSDSVNTLDSTVRTYQTTVNTAVDNKFNDRLASDNTWTGTNTFNGGLTANNVNSTNATINTLNGTNINGTDVKLNNKSLKWTKSGDCTLEGLASNDDGTHISYWTNANTLYITGWVARPKTAYKTFRAYIPASITQRAVNLQNYYVAVNDYDWNYPSTATNPTEFHLDGSKGAIMVNGSGNDGGARLDWVIPLKDA